MLKIKNLSAGYNKKVVLKNIDFEAKSSEITTIIGENGCGKSTLLKSIIGISNIMEGDIFIDDINLKNLKQKDISKKIAYLSQGKNIPDITCEKMVLHGRFPYLSYPRRYSKQDINEANLAINKMGLDDVKDTNLTNLSGGIRQKVYIAMALCQKADIIMLDEPTTYLDISQQFKLMNILKDLKKEGKTIIAITHDIISSLKISDNIVVMNNGKVLLTGTPSEIIQSNIIKRVFNISIRSVETNGLKEYYYVDGEE